MNERVGVFVFCVEYLVRFFGFRYEAWNISRSGVLWLWGGRILWRMYD